MRFDDNCWHQGKKESLLHITPAVCFFRVLEEMLEFLLLGAFCLTSITYYN